MSRWWDVAKFCPLVVNLLYNKLWNCCELVRLVVLYNTSVAGVRVVEFGTYTQHNSHIETTGLTYLTYALSFPVEHSGRGSLVFIQL